MPTVDELRAEAARRGVFPEDEDLELVRRFLEVLLPSLARLEDAVPPGTVPAGMFLPDGSP